MVRSKAFLSGFYLLAFIAYANTCLLTSAQAYTVDDVVNAWTKHSDRIDTIECKVRQERKEKVYKPTPDDHFGHGREEDAISPITLIGEIVFVKANDRLAFLKSSDSWNAEERRKDVLRQHFCFDGVRNASYVEGVPDSVGQVTPSKTPDDNCTNNVEVIPIWWAHMPLKQITQAGDFSPHDLQILNQQDQNRIILKLESRSNKELIYFLTVDATNGFRVTKASMKHKGRKLLDLDVSYLPDDMFGWKVASWECTSINGLRLSATVTECKLNEEAPTDAFEVKFPVGTYMVHSRTFQFLPDKYQADKRD